MFATIARFMVVLKSHFLAECKGGSEKDMAMAAGPRNVFYKTDVLCLIHWKFTKKAYLG